MKISLISLIIFTHCFFFVLQSHAGYQYDITDIGAIDDYGYSFMSINENSGVTGFYNAWSSYYWKDGVRTTLLDRSLGAGGSTATFDINDKGYIVGYMCLYEEILCFDTATIWVEGTPVRLGTSGDGGYNVAYGINNLDQVVGVSSTNNGLQAFVWENGQIKALYTPEGYMSRAVTINDHSQMLGVVVNEDLVYRPALWEGEYFTIIEYPEDIFNPTGRMELNNAGQAVFGLNLLWDSTGTHEIYQGAPNDEENLYLSAYGLNDTGDIVGEIFEVNPNTYFGFKRYPFLLKDGEIMDLNETIGQNLGWGLYEVYDINNKGEIVGVGDLNGELHAFLLSPSIVPEPISAVLTLLGGGMMLIIGRKRI